MIGLKVIKKYLIYSQIFVSLCATLLGGFYLSLQKLYQLSYIVVYFFTFWLGYSFLIFQKNKKTLFICVFGFALISVYILTEFSYFLYLKWLLIIILGLLYNSNFLKIKIREIPILKTFYIGFIWAITLVFLPFTDFKIDFFLMFFFFVVGITIPFEIRDMNSDLLTTIPKKMGIVNSQLLSIILLLSSGATAYIILKTNDAIAFNLSIFVAIVLVIFSHPKRKDHYFSFFMESASALPFIFIKIINYYFQ